MVGWAYLGRYCRIGGPVSSADMEGEGEVGIAPTMLALANGRGLIHQWHVWG